MDSSIRSCSVSPVLGVKGLEDLQLLRFFLVSAFSKLWVAFSCGIPRAPGVSLLVYPGIVRRQFFACICHPHCVIENSIRQYDMLSFLNNDLNGFDGILLWVQLGKKCWKCVFKTILIKIVQSFSKSSLKRVFLSSSHF